MTTQRKHRWFVFLCVASVLCASGCASSASCDEGNELMNDVCVPVTPPAPDAGSGDMVDSGSSSNGGDDAGTEDAAQKDYLGEPCVDNVNHSECGGEADYCAIQPNASEGICTIRNCVPPDTGCPTGWRCFDVSIFDPTLFPICIEE